MPPMLHIALYELPSRGAENLLASERAIGDDERHHILELVTKAVGASRLIKASARPQPTGDRLIEKPAVHEDVQRAIWRRHFHGSQEIVPARLDRSQENLHVCDTIALDEYPCLFLRRRFAEQENDFGTLARR